ncbi:hypothetical protein NKI32_19800 [Mesorhizobium sp. M0761]|uniref:hypothetical protein n=1 Tax=unclassified Mesorhizobium TaxID=325217 RepID=UPI0003D06407|nr:hypothetical protein [Mesorhizobium sp. L103C105A0]ESZ70015.1 hypothetical protein X727_15645 [Mesorhizobium sp. L103C119B0]ESZ78695.1 hypothetical protein X726_05075 [Mesorhizobium sp. L103C105A0]
MISAGLANAIEASFKASRLDIGQQAVLCVAMLEGALSLIIPNDIRAKMEEKLLRGITREHIDQALELMRQDHQ